MKMVVVYDTQDFDNVVFYGTYKEVAEYFKTTEKVIQCNVCKKHLREKRYRIETIKIKDDE